MERLVLTSPAYTPEELAGGAHEYPSNLVTLLVQNYRSHPNILELPNAMFYDNKLVASGEVLSTHSMVNWEHLPKNGFPIIFDSVEGKNEREGSSPSWFNIEEVSSVISYVELLVKSSKPAVRPEHIGIITPYTPGAKDPDRFEIEELWR
jgi:helicase MOV-10